MPTEVETHLGNGQWALETICPRPGKRDMDGVSSSQRIFTRLFRRDFCSPLDLPKWKKNFPVCRAHELLGVGPL